MRLMFACFVAMCVFVAVNCQANHTTTAPTTSTGKPETTTGKPTNGTTVKPTTTAPPTTTPMPVPPKAEPAPVVKYTVVKKDEKIKKDIICLMAEFSAKIKLIYNNTENVTETGYVSFNNNSVASGDSKCGENKTVFTIDIDGDSKNTLTMFVEKEEHKYFVTRIDLKLDEESIKNRIPLAPSEKTIEASMVNQTLFKAPLDKSYICKSDDEMSMSDFASEKFVVKLDVNNVRFDAFRTEEGNSWREGQLCDKDEEFSDIIPIAVGAALAALVVLVLIAYFIGRRRSRRLAYQSV